METRSINPWNWQAGFGFSHATEVKGFSRVLTLSGQCATGPDGAPMHQGDMQGQLKLVMENIEAVLREAGYKLSDIASIRVFSTDIDATLANWAEIVGPLNAAGCRPSSTLVGVTRLFSPDLLVEIEATAYA
ncbi:RidA family protein [Paraburkholderia aspalathi]|nr:RidA family protein [Paraburkholderia aspalathi]